MSTEQICVTSGGNERRGTRGGGGDQSVIVRLSYEQLNTGHKAGISSLPPSDKHQTHLQGRQTLPNIILSSFLELFLQDCNF